MADIFGYGEKDQHFITYSLVIIMSIFCLIFINLFDVITILDDRVISLESQFITDEILTIFREKNQVKEVGTGLECGISIKDFIDFKEKDIIESYLSEKISRSI